MIKFVCERKKFVDAIARVAKGVSNKSTIPELERMRFHLEGNSLELTGYDLEFGIQHTIEVESTDSGEFLVSPNILRESVSRCSGSVVNIEVDDNSVVHLTCAETHMQLAAMSAKDYPSLPELSLEESMEISQATLRSMISQTSYATSQSESKPVLTGELFETELGQLNIAAIDGYRLAVRQENIGTDKNFHFVVPKKTLNEVRDMLSDEPEKMCKISANARNVVFEFNDYTVFSRLLEGEFHNYRSSIPASYDTEILIDTTELTACLKRCSLLISGKYNAPVQCTFNADGLQVWCKTEIGELKDKIPAKVKGPDVVIGFDNHYLLDAVGASFCDQLKIQLTGGNRVAKILPPEGEDFIFLLMPIQLKR